MVEVVTVKVEFWMEDVVTIDVTFLIVVVVSFVLTVVVPFVISFNVVVLLELNNVEDIGVVIIVNVDVKPVVALELATELFDE